MKKIFTVAIMALLAISAFGADSLKVMSYNIRMGKAKDGTNSWQYRYPASAMMLDDQKPDVFGVQEAFDYQVKYLTEYP